MLKNWVVWEKQRLIEVAEQNNKPTVVENEPHVSLLRLLISHFLCQTAWVDQQVHTIHCWKEISSAQLQGLVVTVTAPYSREPGPSCNITLTLPSKAIAEPWGSREGWTQNKAHRRPRKRVVMNCASPTHTPATSLRTGVTGPARQHHHGAFNA